MLSLCAYWQSVCLLWRNVCLGLLPIFQLALSFVVIVELYVLFLCFGSSALGNCIICKDFLPFCADCGLSFLSFFWFFFLFFFSFFGFCFCFSGPNLQRVEVTSLRVKLELQLLAYTTATAMRGLSYVCNLHHSSQQCQIISFRN